MSNNIITDFATARQHKECLTSNRSCNFREYGSASITRTTETKQLQKLNNNVYHCTSKEHPENTERKAQAKNDNILSVKMNAMF